MAIVAGMRAGKLVFVYRAAIVAVAAFVAALAGFGLQGLLPAAYVADAKSTVTSVIGLTGLLLSLLLGLLISTSHGRFTNQQAQLQRIGRAVVQLDFELAAVGADMAATSMLVREQVDHMVARFWKWDIMRDGPRTNAYDKLRVEAETMLVALAALNSATEEQRQRIARAREQCGTFLETQATMIRNLTDRVPTLLLIVVLLWSCLLFFGYGLLAGINALTVAVALLGATAVASAILLILELSDPYSGLFRMPHERFDQLVKTLSTKGVATGPPG